MKAKDVEEFEIGSHCFGKTLTVNGIDYDDLDKESVLELVNDMLRNDINSSSMIKEMFEFCLEHLQYNEVESRSNKCDQCGNYNYYAKYAYHT